MVDALHLYVDDSGTRHPDHNDTPSCPWFALGGVVLRESDEEVVRTRYAQFRERWSTEVPVAPLHSHKIRQRKGAFAWLQSSNRAAAFIDDLTDLMAESPFLCTACVIDRPGYRARYFEKYSPEQRWSLCKTAFAVLMERAAKYALRTDRVLRVFIEKTDKETDRTMRGYFTALRSEGMPFNPSSSSSYAPLDPSILRRTLYDFKTKEKSSPMIQLADLCLYPICRAGYGVRGRDFESLVARSKLIDSVLSTQDQLTLGIKYSCFESIVRRDEA